MRKFLFTGILFTLLSGHFACKNGCDVDDLNITITEMSAEFGVMGQEFTPQTEASYYAAVFNISVEETIDEVIASNAFTGFSSVAYAEDCGHTIQLKYVLEAINITSSAPVKSGGVEYQAGESLNQLFTSTDGTFEAQTYTIPDLIDYINEGDIVLTFRTYSLLFHLAQQPDEALNQTFSFEFVFENESILATTEEVSITID